MIRASDRLGLQPEDYGATQIATELPRLASPNATAGDWRDFDYLLSLAAVRLLTHLHYGRVDPSAAGFELPARPADLDVPAAVAALEKAPNLRTAVAAVEPQFYHYALLKAALAHYRELAAQSDLTRLPAPARKSPRPGDPYMACLLCASYCSRSGI